jgi:16S rRNA processing protein RimM
MPGIREKQPGLHKDRKSAFLVIGKVRRPHGVHGEVVAEIYVDVPGMLSPGGVVYLGDKHEKLVVASLRYHNEGLLIGFEGIKTPEEAGYFRNQLISLASCDAPNLPSGAYYSQDLLGLEVMDDNGIFLGNLIEVLVTGANDVYVVKDANEREILLPAIPDVVKEVNLVARRMKVQLLPGLVD